MPKLHYYRAYIDDGETVYCYTFSSPATRAAAAWVTAVERRIADGWPLDISTATTPEIVKGIAPSIFDLNVFVPVADLPIMGPDGMVPESVL